MSQLLTFITTLHSGRKQYATAATMILLGVGVLTGRVDPSQVTTELKSVTFENVDQQQAPAAPTGTDNGLIGLLLLLLGADSAANRAAIAKGTASAKAPAAGGE